MTTWITPAPKPHADFGRWLVMAQERGGRSYLGQVLDLWRASRGPGRLEADEYYAYRLYSAERELSSFVGRRGVRHLLNEVIRSPWPALSSDQLAIRAMLQGFGLPVPELLAVWACGRHVGDAELWTDTASAVRGLASLEGPVFIKPVDAANSGAVLSVDRVDAGALVLADGRSATPEEVAGQLAARAASAGVQVQRRLTPHPEVGALTDGRIATVRLLFLVQGSEVHLHRAVWRLPAGLSPCDAPWRPGNLLAGVDPSTGRVVSASRGLGPDRRAVTAHPDGRELVGAPVPGWEALVETARAAASAIAWCPIQAWDLALTDQGPVILELEGDGGAPELTQLPFDAGWADARWRDHVSALTARAEARDRARPSWWSTVRETWRAARAD